MDKIAKKVELSESTVRYWLKKGIDEYISDISQLEKKRQDNPDWKIFACDEIVYIIKKYIKTYYGDNEAENPCYDIHKMAKYIIDEQEKISNSYKEIFREINMDYNGKDDIDDRKN